tara:strand:- start:694 stop:1509 length:816 start_codon:yes stop_codon:yes gene_type:complete
MIKFFITFLILFFLSTTQSFSQEQKNGVMEKLKNATCEGFFFGIKAGKNCERINNSVSKVEKVKQKKLKKEARKSKFKKKVCEGFFFGIKAGKDCETFKEDRTKEVNNNSDIFNNEKLKKTSLYGSNSNTNISLYTGTFDVIDKEGDDQTTLFGVEHRNPNLFRNSFLGKIAPVSGAFVTGKNSLYFYTGIEGQYNLGPMLISPSFTPGYYEKGNGKDLGSPLEFKSEVKVGFDILRGSNLAYSYSHISNNDWGSTNPGTDNQHLTFSTKF